MDEPIETSVRRTAALARLEVSEAEVRRLAPQFERILGAFECLASLPLGDQAALERTGAGRPREREDRERPSLAPDDALANAPARDGNFYLVPRTVGGEG